MNQPPFMPPSGAVPGAPQGAPLGPPPFAQPGVGPASGAVPPQAAPPQAPVFGLPPGAPQGVPPFAGVPGAPPGAAPAAPTPAASAGMPPWLTSVPAARAATAQFGSGGASMGSAFSKIANANLTGDGNYLNDGDYILVLKNLLWEDRYSGKVLIAEMIVVESMAKPGMYVSGGQPVDADFPGAVPAVPQRPGEQVSFTSNPENANNPNAKAQGLAFLLALFGIDKAQLVQAQAEAKQRSIPYQQNNWPYDRWPEDARDPLDVLTSKFVGPDQPGRGMLLRGSTRRKRSQGRFNPANKGKILVLPTYTHIASTMEENKRRRELIDASQPLPPTNLLAPVVAPASPSWGGAQASVQQPPPWGGQPPAGAPPQQPPPWGGPQQ